MAEKTSSEEVAPSDLDVGQARKAFEQLEPALKALRADELDSPRVDTQRSAAIAYSIGVRDRAPERRAKFAKLAESGFFELRLLDELCPRALATWYARGEQVRSSSLSSDAKVPDALMSDAMNTRARMLRVLGYYLDDDAALGPTIALLRRGTGYQDLANDLLTSADLYERDNVRAIIGVDKKNYRADDVASARSHAHTIFRALGLTDSDEAQRWAAHTQRAWTLLQRAYEPLRAAAGLLFQDEEVSLTYPSLVGAARSYGSRKVAPAPDPTVPVESGDQV